MSTRDMPSGSLSSTNALSAAVWSGVGPSDPPTHAGKQTAGSITKKIVAIFCRIVALRRIERSGKRPLSALRPVGVFLRDRPLQTSRESRNDARFVAVVDTADDRQAHIALPDSDDDAYPR